MDKKLQDAKRRYALDPTEENLEHLNNMRERAGLAPLQEICESCEELKPLGPDCSFCRYGVVSVCPDCATKEECGKDHYACDSCREQCMSCGYVMCPECSTFECEVCQLPQCSLCLVPNTTDFICRRCYEAQQGTQARHRNPYRNNADASFQQLKRQYAISQEYEDLERLRAAAEREGNCLHETYSCRWRKQGYPNKFTYFLRCNDCQKILRQSEELVQDYPSHNWGEINRPGWCRNKGKLIRCYCGIVDEEGVWHGSPAEVAKHVCREEFWPGIRYRRNADVSLRQLERTLMADPSQQNADNLLTEYKRLGEANPGEESLRYLRVLDMWGTPHGAYISPGEPGKLSYSGITQKQEVRYRELSWNEFFKRAKIYDKSGRLNMSFLREVENLIDRNISNIWMKSVWLVTHDDDPRKRALEYKEQKPYKDTFAELFCRECGEAGPSLCESRAIFDEKEKEYRASPQGQTMMKWYQKKGKEWEDAVWDAEESNTAAVEFMWDHRDCVYNEDDYDDPHYEPPPDTPSLPPVGTQDPNWRRNPYRRNADDAIRAAEREFRANRTRENWENLNNLRWKAGLERLPWCETCKDMYMVRNDPSTAVFEDYITGETTPCPHINVQVDYSNDLEPIHCFDCGWDSHIGCPDCNPDIRPYASLAGRP